MPMKKFLIISLFLAAVSCGPSRHAIHVEMRHPSKSGLELGGKIVSVVYSDTGDAVADSFNENMADAFASALEKDYGTGEGSVGLYVVDGGKGDYSQRDSLVSILMTTGADMVFFFTSPLFQGNESSGVRPLKVNLYCYDGMNKDDKVISFTGSTIITPSNGMEAEAVDAGKKIAESFLSQWKHEQYSIAYYDSQKWYDALMKAEQYDWKGAMDIWFDCLETNDLMKRACAEYNIAVACYMLGDFSLADQWLKKSMADNDMPTMTDALRKRIDARL